MANSSTAAKTGYHARSISFPSTAHPQILSLEDQLCRLKSSSIASTSSSAICHNLGLLNDLYESFDDFLQLPHAQQSLSQYHMEKALDGSLRLLDICSKSKDVLALIKESLQKIESALRRRRGGESGHEDEVHNFQISRKNIKRIAKNCFKNISRQMEARKIKMEVKGQNQDHVLGEVEAVSLPILRSTVSFVFGSESKSLLSKLVPSKQTANQGEVIEKMDQALEVLKGQKTEKIELRPIESIIQELEEGLDCLFRRLLKSRVSLLNILNH